MTMFASPSPRRLAGAFVVILLIQLLLSSSLTRAFLVGSSSSSKNWGKTVSSLTPYHQISMTSSSSSGSSSSSSSNNKSDASQQQTTSEIQRLAVEAVSVSSEGFWVMLRSMAGDGILPLQVTSRSEDSRRATSPESLTLCQLIGGVDMAGAILPPDLLAKMTVLECEVRPKTDKVATAVIEMVKKTLHSNCTSYTEAHPWFRSRVRLPRVTLDEVILDFPSIMLSCRSNELGRLSFQLKPSEAVLQDVCYDYEPDGISKAFIAVALALRYKAPITISSSAEEQADVEFLSKDEINKRFPLASSASNLQQMSVKATENVVRSFQVHKLQGALRIAKEKGDVGAIQAIQEKMDELDSLDDLPTVDIAEDELDKME